MKVVVRKFSADQINLAANISSWSNKEVASFLNEVINPKDANTVIKKLTDEQVQKITDKLGQEPKLPASFKDIYAQFKSIKLPEDKSAKSSTFKLVKPKNPWTISNYIDRWSKGYYYRAHVNALGNIENANWHGEPRIAKALSVYNGLMNDTLWSRICRLCIKYNSECTIKATHYDSDGENAFEIAFTAEGIPGFHTMFMIDHGCLVVKGDTYDRRADKKAILSKVFDQYSDKLKSLL